MRWLRALLAAIAVLWLVQSTVFAAQLMLVGAGTGGAGGAAVSVIRSIQQTGCTITNGNGTCTATISAVTVNKTIVILQGVTTDEASQTNGARYGVSLVVTNTTTITATRGGTTGAVSPKFTVIEFVSGVNSVQSGTIAVTLASSSNTATISAVGANAFVLYLGCSTAAVTLDYSSVQCGVVLTNSTTVTATTGALGTLMTVGYMVADLDSTIVQSIQAITHTDNSTATSFTDTITSIDTTRTLVLSNGETTAVSLGAGGSAHTQVLTNATTVTTARAGTATGARTVLATVVQFAAAAVNGSIQRGVITLAAATSNTATISSVTTSLSVANWNGFRATSANANVVEAALALTNATTVTASVNTAGSPTVGYEVMQFL